MGGVRLAGRWVSLRSATSRLERASLRPPPARLLPPARPHSIPARARPFARLTRPSLYRVRAVCTSRQLGELRGPDASIDSSNIGFGNIFSVDSIDLPDTTPVPGLLITSQRAEPLAAWMSGTELASVSADLERGDLSLEVGIDTQYMFARLWDLSLIHI